MAAFQKTDFLDIPFGRLTETLLGSQNWRFNEVLIVFRRQNCSLFFVKANGTVYLSLSKSRTVATKVDPITLDDSVVDDMMKYYKCFDAVVTCTIVNKFWPPGYQC